MEAIKQKIFVLLLLTSFSSFSQNENNQWRFGDFGGINFNTTPPSAVTNSAINTTEGVASVADRNTGALLFYTNSVTIWNANNVPMQNGTGLFGDPSLSSTTAAVIIPKPNSNSLYYVVTINQTSPNQGIHYSVVDMTLNNGLGGVIPSQKNIFLFANDSEKMMAVPSGDGQGYWLITHNVPGNSFTAFKLDQNGFNVTPVISTGGIVQTFGPNHFKMNRQLNKLAITDPFSNKVELFEFNNCTGVLSNPIEWRFSLIPGFNPYGLEFSPDGTKLYISTTVKIVQFDISSNNPTLIENSAFDVIPFGSQVYFSMQLGPDNKIYVASSSTAVINNPNSAGANCNFQANVFTFPNTTIYAGLQNWIYGINNPVPVETPNSIIATNNCVGSPTSFSLQNQQGIVSVDWNFGDPSSSNNTATGLAPIRTFNFVGNYTITATINYNCRTEIVTLPITINSTQTVSVQPISLCQGSTPPTLPNVIPNTTIAGTWSPSQINTTSIGTSNYTFTPNPGQCVSSAAVVLVVTIIQNTTPTFTIPLSICKNSAPPILPTTSSNGVSGQWQPAIVNNQTSGKYTFTPTSTVCATPITINIEVIQNVIPEFSFETNLCTNQSVPILPTISDNGVSGVWSPDTINSLLSGTYVFTPNSNQCSEIVTLNITINTTPVIQIEQSCQGLNYTVQATSSVNASFEWYDSFNSSLGVSNAVIITNPGSYTVVATSNGCTSELEFTVANTNCLKIIPKGISPNGDSLNDRFDLSTLDVKELSIFNRYGVKVYNQSDYSNQWFGQTQNGDQLPDGTYYYVIDFNSGDHKSGWVYISREY